MRGIKFLIFVVISYVFLFIYDPSKGFLTLKYFIDTLIRVFLIIFTIIPFMALINYLSSKENIREKLKSTKPARMWIITIIAGILSIGPLFIWYDLLKNSKMKPRYVFSFAYSRSINLHYTPILIYYFGLKVTLLMYVWIIVLSMVGGILFEILYEKI